MTDDVPTTPTQPLSYFVEWGGRAWVGLVRRGLDTYLGRRLDGLRALEIGARSGRMSSLIALRGADVLGVDINPDFVSAAEAEARRWGVEGRVQFAVDDGELGSVPDASIDVVFTKSVLVVVPELEAYLCRLAAKMRPGGRLVFVENGRGNLLLHAARRWRHRQWDHRRVNYFGEEQIGLIRRVFDVEIVAQTAIPPVYLVCGRVRGQGSA